MTLHRICKEQHVWGRTAEGGGRRGLGSGQSGDDQALDQIRLDLGSQDGASGKLKLSHRQKRDHPSLDPYRETHPRLIYAIVNLTISRVYVGQSGGLFKRLVQHTQAFQAGTHPNGALRADWIAVGADGFCCEILQVDIPEALCLQVEDEWIGRLESAGVPTYNIGRLKVPVDPATLNPLARDLGSRGWEPYTATCAHCGKTFETKRRTRGGLQPARYCSGSCRTLAYRMRLRRAAKP